VLGFAIPFEMLFVAVAFVALMAGMLAARARVGWVSAARAAAVRAVVLRRA
jgi:hypothetical protein